MKTVKALKQHLAASQHFKARYDTSPDDKVHLLYVSPTLNATGYYRMIAPALEINTTATHKAIITSIETHDFREQLSNDESPLEERLIAWADYIIFPVVFSDMSYLILAIKTLNPKVQLVMDIDKNYFVIPHTQPLSRKLKQDHHNALQTNMNAMDVLLTATLPLKHYLQKRINTHDPEADTLVAHSPSLVSRLAYEDIQPLAYNTTAVLRIGLIKPTEDELHLLKDILRHISSTLKGKIQWVYLGKPPESSDAMTLLKTYEFEMHKTVAFTDYFAKLAALKLDMVLLPANDSLYTRHATAQLFLELSVYGIPVVSSIYHAASAHIEDGVNGFIAHTPPEWTQAITMFITSKTLRSVLRKHTIKTIWKHYSFNSSTIETLAQIFI